MPCSITLTGVSLECGNVGGLKELYIAPIEDVSALGFTGTTGGQWLNTITMVSTKKFKKFSFSRGNANFVSTGNRDDAAGTVYNETVVTAQFNKMETAKRTEMVSLSKGNTYVIALDNNGLYWFIGYGSYVSGGVNAQSGAQFGESNNYVVTLTAQTAELPFEVNPTAISSII